MQSLSKAYLLSGSVQKKFANPSTRQHKEKKKYVGCGSKWLTQLKIKEVDTFLGLARTRDF